MKRSYTRIDGLASEAFRRKEAGETNRQIAEDKGYEQIRMDELVDLFTGERCVEGK